MKISSAKKSFFAGIIGNICEHYDHALFGLLAPFIAPLFFPETSPISALILTYGMMILGIISKPIGALFFGSLGDRFGRKKALVLSLMGMAFVTCLMGSLPTYQVAGPIAPCLLALCRFFQSFFSSGETTGGAIFVLEHAEEKEKSFLSSLYDCSSILGIFLASGVVTIFCFQKEAFAAFWRIPFFLGGLCAVSGLVVRSLTEEPFKEFSKISLKDHFQSVWENRLLILPILCAAGFSYSIYTHIFTLMNGFLPFVSNISKQEACATNTLLLFVDFLLLPFFGLMAKKWTKEWLMRSSAFFVLVLAIPLFSLLEDATIHSAIFVRMGLVTLGVAFAAAYHHWAQEQVPREMRYTVVATGTALGSQLIGLPSATISLWMYQKTNLVIAPAFYLMFTAALALLPIYGRTRKTDSVKESE